MSDVIYKRHLPVPPLRLLMIAAGYKPSWVYGGPTISISTLSEALAANGLNVTVMTTNANGRNDFEYPSGTCKSIEGVEVRYYRRWYGDPMSISPAHTWALIRNIRKYDLVHINGWWNWVAMLSLLICKITGTPHVLTTRGALSEYTFQTKRTGWVKNTMHHLLFKRMLAHTLLHVTSEEEALKFKRVLPETTVVVLPNIIQLPQVQYHQANVDMPLKLLFLGRIDPVKNLEMLVEALNQVNFRYILTIVGDGKSEYVESVLAKAKDVSAIQWVGPVYDDRKNQYLADADALVLVSHSENFGNVVIEAMAQSTPVLLSRNVGLSEWVEQNGLGWVVSPDLESLIAGLEAVNADRKYLSDIRAHVLDQVHKDYAMSRLADRYINECYHLVNADFYSRQTQLETA